MDNIASSNTAGGGAGHKPLMFRSMFATMDPHFTLELINNICRGVSSQKTSDIFYSLIALLDEHFIELLRVYIRILEPSQSSASPSVANSVIIKKSNSSSSISDDDNSFLSHKNVVNRMASAYLKTHTSHTIETLLTAQLQAISTGNHGTNGELNGDMPPLPMIGLGGAAYDEHTLLQLATSIINSLHKSVDRYSPQTYHLMEVLLNDTRSLGQTYHVELAKRVFFTKLVCPILANLKPAAWPITSNTKRLCVELSRVISDIVENGGVTDINGASPNPSPSLSRTMDSPRHLHTQQLDPTLLINDFITLMGSRFQKTSSYSNINSLMANRQTSGPVSNKDEAFAYFVHYLKTEYVQLDEFFRKSKDAGGFQAERNFYLYGIFKELINGIKSMSMGIGLGGFMKPSINGSNVGGGSGGSGGSDMTPVSITHSRSRSGNLDSTKDISGSPSTKRDHRDGGVGNIVEFKKWASDELKSTYNGRSYKRRCQVLDTPIKQKEVFTFNIFLSDTNVVLKSIRVPMTATVGSIVSRLLSGNEMPDLVFGSASSVSEYEMCIRYGERVQILGTTCEAGSPSEVRCELDMPLWMYDVGTYCQFVLRPQKKRSQQQQQFSIYLKCLCPSVSESPSTLSPREAVSPATKTNSTPVIILASLQSTPTSIINDILLKQIVQLDPARLSLFLYDMEETATSTTPIQLASERVLAINKIGSMDIIECGYRQAYELASTLNGNYFTTAIDHDTTIENATGSLLGLVESQSRLGFGAAAHHGYTLAHVSQMNRLLSVLASGSKLSDYQLSVGDEVVLTPVRLVTTVDIMARNNTNNNKESSLTQTHQQQGGNSRLVQYLTNKERLSRNKLLQQQDEIASAGTGATIRHVFRITWIGPSQPPHTQSHTNSNASISNSNSNSSGNLLRSPLQISNGGGSFSPLLINNNNNKLNLAPMERKQSIFLSNTLTLDPSLVSRSKVDYCINSDLKLCFLGDENPDKYALFNMFLRATVNRYETPGPTSPFGGSSGSSMFASPLAKSTEVQGTECGVRFADWTFMRPDQMDYLSTYKMYYFSGVEQFQATHPLFITPESVFVITYPAQLLVESTIEYWMQIIQAKAPGSSVVIIGTSTDDVSKRTQLVSQTLLSRYTNVAHSVAVNIKSLRHVRDLIYTIQDIAKQKQFRNKIPISYVLLRNQLLETAREAERTNSVPVTSRARIASIAKSIGLAKDEVDDAILYLLRCGDVLSGNNGSVDNGGQLADLLFLSPAWLSKLLATVFTFKHQNGYLMRSSMYKAWEDRYPRTCFASMSMLLEHFDIIHSGGDNDSESVMVPMLYSEEKPAVTAGLWPEFQAADVLDKVHHERIFQFQFLPKGFFSRLSIRLLQVFDPLSIWYNGIVLQYGGQVFGGIARGEIGQTCIEYDSTHYTLKVMVRDKHNGTMLKNLIEIISSFILWYFPDRLVNTYVTCTHCIEQRIRDNPTRFSLDVLEKEASQGNNHVLCNATNLIRINELAFEVTIHSNKSFSIIDTEELMVGPPLGSGSFATVYRGIWNQSDVAIKKLILDEDDTSTEKFREFRHEVQINGELHHENIVSLKGVTMNPFCIVTELLRFGDLSKFLRNTSDAFTWSTILKLAMDIAQGMNFLHSCKPMVIHRDLKSANILIGGQSMDTLVAKVSDFGLSVRHIDKEVKGRKVWNWRWLAPEIIKNMQYTEKIDIYSYSMVIWELITREVPFEEFFAELKWNNVIEDKIIGGLRPTIPATCPEAMANLMRDCWHDDPKLRPSFADIITALKSMQQSFPLSTKVEYSRSIYDAEGGGVGDSPSSGGDATATQTSDISPFITPRSLACSPISEALMESPRSYTSRVGEEGLGINILKQSLSSSFTFCQQEESPIAFKECLSSVLTSSILCMMYVHLRQEPQVWCGCADGSVTVINVHTKVIISSYRSADATKILGIVRVYKSSKINPLTVDDDIQVWAYHQDGITVYDPKQPYKPLKVIKTNVGSMFDDGKSVFCTGKEKNVQVIKVFSKTKLKCKKTISLANRMAVTLDSYPITSMCLVKGVTSGVRCWMGNETRTSKLGRYIWVASERTLSIYGSSSTGVQIAPQKKYDNVTARVMSLALHERLVYAPCWDGSILVFDKDTLQCVHHFVKKHSSDPISFIVSVKTSLFTSELWVSGWDKRIAVYTLTSSDSTSDHHHTHIQGVSASSFDDNIIYTITHPNLLPSSSNHTNSSSSSTMTAQS
ncbi:hypothetical protein SAMD00019534_071190 [Acytostelium subglobosum LB1]|uniref:hypothetical protein n=1 Tax=Acytostelium subglobosum LB1 TaxID=1410327 RepID=UPI0006449999|nr:hypothetical protein SAMD00019534_071190 [Acytostelium subglobosum LB1]GAM23944.1 hypothetical protein SAMD00019534_071190 [Acytostelium subglobosum LB1]|eukprot:XP_012752980.1 hypothetical protein SAMD00019534_071190 [Acytostelium subglobosum LB1]